MANNKVNNTSKFCIQTPKRKHSSLAISIKHVFIFSDPLKSSIYYENMNQRTLKDIQQITLTGLLFNMHAYQVALEQPLKSGHKSNNNYHRVIPC